MLGVRRRARSWAGIWINPWIGVGRRRVRLTKPEQLPGPEGSKTWTGDEHVAKRHLRRSLEGRPRHSLPKSLRGAHRQRARWLAGLRPDDFIVYAAASGCDRALRRALDAAGRSGKRFSPLHAWHFACSLNLPKTDRVDAAMLARLGAERRPVPDPAPDPAREALRDLVQRRDQLKRMQAQEKKPAAAAGRPGHPFVAKSIRGGLAHLARQVAAAEKAVSAHLNRHPALRESERLLRSIPGLGPVAAATLIAHLPELGTLDRRAIATLGGLAPRARKSDRYRGKRSLGDGRRHISRALYMAGLAALRLPGALADAAARMQDARKPGEVIVIAIARRLLVIANAVFRDQSPYRKIASGLQ